MRATRRLLILACLLLPCRAVPARAAACGAEPLARLALHDAAGFTAMQAALDEIPASMLLDTGAEAGLLTPQAAEGLGLRLDPARRSLLRGTGGVGAVRPNVVLPELDLGALRVGPLSLPVAPLPAVPRLSPPVAGLVGADLLAGFDLLLELGAGRLELYAPGTCAGRAPWPDARAQPLRRMGPRLALDAVLDGLPVSALVDTGTRALVLSERAAGRLGVEAAKLAADPGGVTQGIDLRDAPYHWHRFGSLRIGGETLARPVLTVTELRDEAELLLGRDWLATHRLWLSGHDGLAYVIFVPQGKSRAASGPPQARH